jgi:hypothetical protein
MITIAQFTAPYAANPATTTLFTVTGAGVAANYVVKVFGTTDDITNVAAQSVDMSYLLTWNGITFTAKRNLSGVSPGAITWSLAGNVASFNFTPAGGSGSVGAHVTLAIPNTNSPGFLSY